MLSSIWNVFVVFQLFYLTKYFGLIFLFNRAFIFVSQSSNRKRYEREKLFSVALIGSNKNRKEKLSRNFLKKNKSCATKCSALKSKNEHFDFFSFSSETFIQWSRGKFMNKYPIFLIIHFPQQYFENFWFWFKDEVQVGWIN